ncbi:hypothetical protein EVJ58_g7647 [Rhodofomes roseus]|uniref:S-adenosyl-L-methionine-dependent methyltransferase n=1 Tax=Rhodofomes roseus TaxID=34475 RepID=A0A4Y9Y1U7_9APHY|nr:hypothetical protein EVJ58_g7647 [Rhodofomes roseus]
MSSSATLRQVLRARPFASLSSSPINIGSVGPYQVFDRHAKRLQKDRSALREGGARSRTVDYVRDEVADRMIERMVDIKRKFKSVLDVGSGSGHFSKLLEPETTQKVVMLDSSKELLHRDPDDAFEVEVERIHADEESLLSVVEPNSQEAVVSCLSLHWVNDLPGVLVQIKETLQPDGVFLGALFGGDTLFELRTALQLAEMEREGGISPHISPMTGTLAGHVESSWPRRIYAFNLDVDEVKVAYPSMWELMDDLRDMGESNAVIGRSVCDLQRQSPLFLGSVQTLITVIAELHGHEDGSVPATFQIIYVIGWKPSPKQPKPLERGTGETNLKEVL